LFRPIAARLFPGFPRVCSYNASVKHPLFFNEVLVHEKSKSVGIAKVTYYPVDGTLKDLRIGLELRDGTRRDFSLAELRGPSPEEEVTLQYTDSE
jgi:hypothetical protein